jgi:uronate dehydrogenase
VTAGVTLLMTGAAGRLATMLRPVLADAGHVVRLSDVRAVAPACASESFVRARLESPRQMRRACRGAGALLHLGAISQEEDWEALIAANVAGLVNCLEAARGAGITRIVVASTMHVLGMHPRSVPIDEASAPAPDSKYAATKLFAEGASRMFADKYGLSVTVVRIGHTVADLASAAPGQGVTERDLARIVLLALSFDAPGFTLLHAIAPHDGYQQTDGRLRARHGFDFADPGPCAAAIFDRLGGEACPDARRFRGGDFASR